MNWSDPPKIKIYEALGAIGDERIKLGSETAQVFSSSGNKFYTIEFDPKENAITSNDNGSFWKGYLGYPAITYLLAVGKIKYDYKFAESLKGIAWKDINTNYKNDFDKTLDFIQKKLENDGIVIDELEREVDNILEQIKKMNLKKLKSNLKPPVGY